MVSLNRLMVPMTSTRLPNLSALLDDAKCFALVRQHRWPDGVHCPSCGSAGVARHGRDDTQPHRQRYRCTACTARFDDLSGTALAGHHRPLRVWVLCLYLMGCTLQPADRARAGPQRLGCAGHDRATAHWAAGADAAIALDGEVEIDEVYVVAGHKVSPTAVAKKAAWGAGAGSRAHPAGAHSPKRGHRSWA